MVLRVPWLQSPAGNFFFKIIVLFIFLDTGYLVYLNSFFGEATTLIFLLLAFVMLLLLERGKVHPVFYIGLLVSLFVFSGSKTANFPSAVLLGMALIFYVLKNEDLPKKLVIGAAVLVMLWGAAGYVKNAPQWMQKVTTYHAVFFGVLKDHPEPEKAIKELGLPEELLQLESTHGYLRHPYDIYGDDFAALFFDHVGKGAVLRYYLTHPGYFLKKLDKSAEAALPLRPTYLSNTSTTGDLVFTGKLNVWETARKRLSGKALFMISGILLLSLLNLLSLWRKRADGYRVMLRLALVGCAAGQFIVPVIGNGEADLIKHMFLFNIHLDLLLVMLLYDPVEAMIRH